MRAICNKGCTKEFEVRYKERHIEKDVWRVCFECSNCKMIYTAYYHNREIRKLQNIMRITRDEILAESTRTKIKKEMDRLKVKIDGR